MAWKGDRTTSLDKFISSKVGQLGLGDVVKKIFGVAELKAAGHSEADQPKGVKRCC